jgi:hypothetical protein
MKACIESIEEKQDQDRSRVELRITVSYQNYRATIPQMKDFVCPYMIKENGEPREEYKDHYTEAMQKYFDQYHQWEQWEIERIQHNNAISKLCLGNVDLSQAPFCPDVVRARPKELNAFFKVVS